MLYTRYATTIIDVNSVEWTVKIMQDAAVPYAVEEIVLSGDTPIEIEWKDIKRSEQIMSSSCTLNLISDKDRRFLDLYQIGYGGCRLDLYKGLSLYWSGCIDPELYEEPYTSQTNYTVSITFSDFGPLKYFNWDDTGILSLNSVIEKCIHRMSLNSHVSISNAEKYMSISLPGESASETLALLSVNTENFYDEDGEGMVMYDVLEEVLKCLGLQMKQLVGKLIIYDTNFIADLTPELIRWTDTDASLSFDEIYNNIKLTYSPYILQKLISATLDYEDIDLNMESISSTITYGYKGVIPCYDSNGNSLVGFYYNTSTSPNDNGLCISKADDSLWFKIKSVWSGSDECGIAAMMYGYYKGWVRNGPGYGHVDLNMSNWNTISDVMTVNIQPYLLGNINSSNNSDDLINLKMSICIDDRTNPFESDDMTGQKGSHFSYISANANFVYIPIKLEILSDDNTVIYHYENKKLLTVEQLGYRGEWKVGPAGYGDAWLAYYELPIDENKAGMRGWKTNKIMRYRNTSDNSDPLASKIGDGQLIPLPPINGRIKISIGSGTLKVDKHHGDILMIEDDLGNDVIKWMLYKDVNLSIIDKNGKDIDDSDITYSAWLNSKAKEDLSIDTIIGSSPTSVLDPTSRGQLLYNHVGVNQLKKNNITDVVEKLLIGSIYSNYATRKMILSGTVDLSNVDKMVYTDAADDKSRKYMVMGDIQRIRENEREIILGEIIKDNFKGVDWT